MARVNIELTEKDVQDLIIEHLRQQLSSIAFDPKKVNIQVKSAKNYKAEWEVGKSQSHIRI